MDRHGNITTEPPDPVFESIVSFFKTLGQLMNKVLKWDKGVVAKVSLSYRSIIYIYI